MRNHPTPGSITARIRSELRSLHPSEQRVAEVFLRRSDWTIQASTQQVADEARTSRATVVRTAQKLGFTGYPQLRVLLARDLALAAPPPRPPSSDTLLGALHTFADDISAATRDMVALASEESLRECVTMMLGARRILVVATGLSTPTAVEAAMRLDSLGLMAEFPADQVTQGLRARNLEPADVCLAISSSGATHPTLAAAKAASACGAGVIAITASNPSPLTDVARVTLVSGSAVGSFPDDITHTPRLPQSIAVHALIRLLAHASPDSAKRGQGQVLDVLGDLFFQDPN